MEGACVCVCVRARMCLHTGVHREYVYACAHPGECALGSGVQTPARAPLPSTPPPPTLLPPAPGSRLLLLGLPTAPLPSQPGPRAPCVALPVVRKPQGSLTPRLGEVGVGATSHPGTPGNLRAASGLGTRGRGRDRPTFAGSPGLLARLGASGHLAVSLGSSLGQALGKRGQSLSVGAGSLVW